MIVPEFHPDFSCPEMIFECIKRVFMRPSNKNLSHANKLKAVEVILKIAKLYDGIDLNDEKIMKNDFNDVLRFDFL
jgi:hypothetical protein